jgi:hypothetical protein
MAATSAAPQAHKTIADYIIENKITETPSIAVILARASICRCPRAGR